MEQLKKIANKKIKFIIPLCVIWALTVLIMTVTCVISKFAVKHLGYVAFANFGFVLIFISVIIVIESKIYGVYTIDDFERWIEELAVGKEIDKGLYAYILEYMRIIMIRYDKKYSNKIPIKRMKYISVFKCYIFNQDLENNPSEMKRLCKKLQQDIQESKTPIIETPDKSKKETIRIEWSKIINFTFLTINVLFWMSLVIFKIKVTLSGEIPKGLLSIIYNVGGDIMTAISFVIAFVVWKRYE